jgi:hypothetical protein
MTMKVVEEEEKIAGVKESRDHPSFLQFASLIET